MMTSDHYLGEHMDIIVINLADVTSGSDNGGSTETASIGSNADKASETK